MPVLEWIRENAQQALAIAIGLLIVISAFVAPEFWGERGVGVILGIAIVLVVVPLVGLLADQFFKSVEGPITWAMVIVPVGAALLLGRAFASSSLKLPIHVSIPAASSPKNLMLTIAGITFIILLLAFIRSLTRGEGVAIESYWGGLGGGLAGWRLSAPLIYLLGIVFLLAISSVLAWRMFLPASPVQQGSPTLSLPSASASPAVSPSL